MSAGHRAAPALPRVHPTVVHMLADAAARVPHGEALVCGEQRLDYASYLECVRGFAVELGSLGARGGRVATLLGNSIDACIAACATQRRSHWSSTRRSHRPWRRLRALPASTT